MGLLKGVEPQFYYVIGGVVALFCITALFIANISAASANKKACIIDVPNIPENKGFPPLVYTTAEKKRCCELATAFYQEKVMFDDKNILCEKEFSIKSPLIPIANSISDIKETLYKILISSRRSSNQLDRIENRLDQIEKRLSKT